MTLDANDRCQQENILAQLNAVRALHAPFDNLLSNNAYMLITSLAWNLKAWLALRVGVFGRRLILNGLVGGSRR
ncbi:MAG: hypothetical protein HY290_33715 [Planctomycetia bacterium]|nr:hypothetical protein [Planctomycetia bacterium]